MNYKEDNAFNAPILIDNNVLKTLESQALKRPSKDGAFTPRLVRLFLEHMEKIHGLDLNIETEDMHNERLEREAREDKQKRKLGSRVGRKSFRNTPDDF